MWEVKVHRLHGQTSKLRGQCNPAPQKSRCIKQLWSQVDPPLSCYRTFLFKKQVGEKSCGEMKSPRVWNSRTLREKTGKANTTRVGIILVPVTQQAHEATGLDFSVERPQL